MGQRLCACACLVLQFVVVRVRDCASASASVRARVWCACACLCVFVRVAPCVHSLACVFACVGVWSYGSVWVCIWEFVGVRVCARACTLPDSLLSSCLDFGWCARVILRV